MTTIDEVLVHFGVKGMRWGVRKDRPGTTGGEPVTIRVRAGKRVVTTGGHGHAPSEDALRVADSRQKARKSSTDALSTQELQALVTRMNLERQYSQLKPTPAGQKIAKAGAKFAADTLLQAGKKQAAKLLSSHIERQVSGLLAGTGVKKK
jgi:hypothetical protein